MIEDSVKRFMVRSTDSRIKIFQSLAEKSHLDIHSIINSLMLEWVLNNLDDPELADPVKEIFKD